MTKSTTFILRHTDTNTCYGFRPISTSTNHNVLPIGYHHNDPKYNIVCFPKSRHAKYIARSIHTHYSIFNKLPECLHLCVYPEQQLLDDDELIKFMEINEIDMVELKDMTEKRNLGVFMVIDIQQSDAIISVDGRELIHNPLFSDINKNTRDVLENDFKLDAFN